MKRREFLGGMATGIVAAGPALASDLVDSIVRQLKKQGFKSISTERTLLGRVRILADRKDGSREIIINPRTGEILRDLWTPTQGGKSGVEIIRDPGSSGGGGTGGKDHDDDDDDDDDDGGEGGGGGED